MALPRLETQAEKLAKRQKAFIARIGKSVTEQFKKQRAAPKRGLFGQKIPQPSRPIPRPPTTKKKKKK